MKDYIELLKEFFPISSILILIIFGYLLFILVKISKKLVEIADKEKDASKNQTDYLNKRIESIEKVLNINTLSFDFQEKQLHKFQEIAKEQEIELNNLITEKKDIEKKLEDANSELNILLNNLSDKDKSIKKLTDSITNLEEIKSENHKRIILHELYQILPVIKGLSLRIKNSKNNPSRIENFARDLIESIDILDITIRSYAVSSKEIVNNPNVRFSLLQSIFKIKHTLEKQLLYENIDCKLEYSDEFNKVEIIGEAYYFEIVLYQLLINAIKYSVRRNDLKSIVIISLTRKMEFIEISFINEGLRISEEESKNIFKAYYRGKSGEYHQGIGMGLFVSKKIIESMTGKIDFFSVKKSENIYLNTCSITLPLKIIAKE